MNKNTTVVICVAIVAVLIGVAIFVFGTGTAKSNGIELTLDNYKQYLKIDSSYIREVEKTVSVGYYGNILRCNQLNGVVKVTGGSTNFNYNNVKITVRFSGAYGTTTLASVSGDPDKGTYTNFNEIVELTLNISGDGHIETPIVVAPSGKAIVQNIGSGTIIAISGTVTPA